MLSATSRIKFGESPGSVFLRFVNPYGGSNAVGGFNGKEEPVRVWVVKRRPCSDCRGYVINAREAAELEHVDEAFTAAQVGTVAFFIHKHAVGIAARGNCGGQISVARIYGCETWRSAEGSQQLRGLLPYGHREIGTRL